MNNLLTRDQKQRALGNLDIEGSFFMYIPLVYTHA
jgi:hypothetical protein